MIPEDDYLHTNYYADALTQPIRINEHNQGLNELLKSKSCETWAYITAYNPFSELLPVVENVTRNKELEMELAKFKIFPGRGVGADGKWPAEESFLILGISKNEAIELGKKYEQNAIVFGKIDGVPELVILLL